MLNHEKNCTDHFSTCVFAVHESARNNIRSQELITLTELLEDDPVWKTLATDSDSFEDAIAS